MIDIKTYYDSAEYDLYKNQNHIKILRTHQIASVMYTGSQSQLFKLKSEKSDNYLLIKAISKNQNYKIVFDDLKELSHERLPKIFETYETKKYYYIVKEYIAGLSLTKYVQMKKTLNEEETVRLSLQLIEVIKYLHNPERNIVYRDIKPDNIIIDHEDNLYLIDLETIRTYKKEQESDTVAIVTKGYAAPEQYGYSQTDGRADIYSIGATLFYMLLGKPLVTFWLNSLEQSKNLDVDYNRLSKKWKYIINKCTKFNPDDRYENISKLEKDILGNKLSLFFQMISVKLIRNKMSILAIIFMVILGYSYWNINNGGNANIEQQSRDYLTFERMLSMSFNKPKDILNKPDSDEEMITNVEKTTVNATETEQDADQEMELAQKKAYEEKLKNIPLEMKELSYSIRTTLSNIQVNTNSRVLIQVWDEYGNGNQTGRDSVDSKNDVSYIECISPVKALYLLEGYKYDFIAYVDNAPRNFNLDIGESYSKRLDFNYEGGMNIDIEFFDWEIYNGGSYDD